MAPGDDPAVVGLEGDVTVRVRGVDLPGEVKVFVRGTYERFIAHSTAPIPVGTRVRVERGHGPRAVDVTPLPGSTEAATTGPSPDAFSGLPKQLDELLADHGDALSPATQETIRTIRAGVFTLTRYPLSDAGVRKVESVVTAVVERVHAYLALVRPKPEDQHRLSEQLDALAAHVDTLLDDLDQDLRTGIKAMDAGLTQRFHRSELDLPE